ncbi:Arv1 protein [Thamnocephalis sphaerospora]|uniref:Protein ARV n=1 Tax=Thamnocephalis sphaerospora TaxID=78915 RepID=A0A4P9XR67_9FUNG|nr:Arv1 protein [Thamnocephalis sphaerospora]|eukprot:RKP08548.1 Arv1 protein [Thamnocephalis sphaerospora]
MLCVECGRPVNTLYTEYSKGNIRLTPCDACGRFVDKYVELDFVVIFIDLLLHKPQVYRHLLFNRLEYYDKGFHPSVAKLAVLLVLFDVYIRWYRLERYYADVMPEFFSHNALVQYVYLLLLCVIELCVFHIVTRWLVWLWFYKRHPIINYNYLSMALTISSFSKLLLILMVIWDYSRLEYARVLGLFEITSNLEAISVFLGSNLKATLPILVAGVAARWLTQYVFIQLTGNIIPFGIITT